MKFLVWYNALVRAYETRWLPSSPDNRQYISFASMAGKLTGRTPFQNAEVMNSLLHDWLGAVDSGRDKFGNDLGAQRVRSGVGVIAMDFPRQDNIDALIRANYGWTYRLWDGGGLYLAGTLTDVLGPKPT